MAAKIEIVPQAALPSVRKSARWKPRIIDRWAGRGVAMAGVSIIVGAMTESEDFAALFAAHQAKVAAVIKGGYEVTVGGLRAFCPFSQMDLRRVESEQDFVGRVLEFRVTRFEEGGRNIVLSRRRILEEQAAKAAEETRKKIAVDAVLPGTVTSLADFGAFVDLGGIQGLVPMSELSHARVVRAGDRLHVGEAVTVKVIRIDEAKGRVTLSLKALEGDPWAAVPGRLRERQVV